MITGAKKTYDPLSIGVDIETGGHVFQLFFTNSLPIIEKGFIGETAGNCWTVEFDLDLIFQGFLPEMIKMVCELLWYHKPIEYGKNTFYYFIL